VIRQFGRGLLGIAMIALFLSVPFIVRAVISGTAPDVATARPSASEVPATTPSARASAVEGPSVPERSSASPSAPSARLARPIRVEIPAIDVNAELRPIGLHDDGSMEVPPFGLAGWYRLGPRPGEPGPAVIVAHVDSHQGPDVFFRLRELSPGDEVKVSHEDGTWSRFVVQSGEQQLKEELPVDRIWNKTRDPVLRLVTCGGEFDEVERHYRSNVIVYTGPAAT
jgi:sortase (surface protein transpeptidase)